MVVVPVIGLLFDKIAFHPTLNKAEVEVVFDAPLEMFLKVQSHSSLFYGISLRGYGVMI